MKSIIQPNHTKPTFTIQQIIQGIEGVAIMIACYLTFFLKPLRDSWGLNKIELKQKFPGDEIVDKPKAQFTHGIEINAPAKMVWPWIAQLGQGRGGFYSYEALENLTGLNIYNSDKILPEFQNPKVGDKIPFSQSDAYPLVICEPGSAMAISLVLDMDKKKLIDPVTTSTTNFIQISWLWYVRPIDELRSKFYSRNRVNYYPPAFRKKIFAIFLEPIVFAMDRKMCLGIKKRAKKLYNDIESKNMM